ncbi:MAG: DUF6514 family protein [Clostridiales bacterium]|nr:DUF6514 family protein [Clostridiales bacterium]
MNLKKVLIGNSESCPKNSYYLIERDFEGGLFYGVSVENDDDSGTIPSMFEDREEAELFIKLLMRNDVSPIHIYEAADDYIGRLCFDESL